MLALMLIDQIDQRAASQPGFLPWGGAQSWVSKDVFRNVASGVMSKQGAELTRRCSLCLAV